MKRPTVLAVLFGIGVTACGSGGREAQLVSEVDTLQDQVIRLQNDLSYYRRRPLTKKQREDKLHRLGETLRERDREIERLGQEIRSLKTTLHKQNVLLDDLRQTRHDEEAYQKARHTIAKQTALIEELKRALEEVKSSK